MLTRVQKRDSNRCDELSEQGEDMDCLECSCSVCIAQIDNKDFEKGLQKSIDIIKKEMEFAKTVNSQMAMGMSQVLMLIEKELKNK